MRGHVVARMLIRESEGSRCNRLKKHHVGAGLGILAILAAVPVRGLPLAPLRIRLGEVRGRLQRRRLELAGAGAGADPGDLRRPRAALGGHAAAFDQEGPACGAWWSATCIGFTAVVLFGRAGEPVRPYLIARKEGVSFSSQVAAWLVERILDLLMVLLIFGIALTQISRSGIQPGPHIQSALQAGGLLAGITGALCLALLLGLRQFRGSVRTRLMDALSFLPDALHQKVARFLHAFEEGMQSTQRQSYVWLLVFYTIIEWW